MIEQGSRDSFVVYRSFVESIRKFHQLGVLTSDNVASLFYVMGFLALDGEESGLEPIEDAVFTQLRPQIEANREKASKGKHGGRPEKEFSEKDLAQKYGELGDWDAVAQFFGISRKTVYNIRKKMDAQAESCVKTPDCNYPPCVKSNVNENENENEKREGLSKAQPAELQAAPLFLFLKIRLKTLSCFQRRQSPTLRNAPSSRKKRKSGKKMPPLSPRLSRRSRLTAASATTA